MFENEELKKLASEQKIYIRMLFAGFMLSCLGGFLLVVILQNVNLNTSLVPLLPIIILIIGIIMGIYGGIKVGEYQKEINIIQKPLIEDFQKS